MYDSTKKAIKSYKDKKTAITLYLDKEMAERLRAYAKVTGDPLNSILPRAFEEYVERNRTDPR